MVWTEAETAWFEVCRGERCAICEQPIGKAAEKRFRYCEQCVPRRAEKPHRVLINVDHDREGYSAHVVSEEEPPFTLWMIRLDRKQVDALLNRGRVHDRRREEAKDALQKWSRTSLGVHLDPDAFLRLREAARRDPRTGYEKERELERQASTPNQGNGKGVVSSPRS